MSDSEAAKAFDEVEEFLMKYMPVTSRRTQQEREKLLAYLRTRVVPVRSGRRTRGGKTRGAKAARDGAGPVQFRGLADDQLAGFYRLLLKWMKEEIGVLGEREFERYLRAKERELHGIVQNVHNWAEKHFGNRWLSLTFDSGAQSVVARMDTEGRMVSIDPPEPTERKEFTHTTQDLSSNIVFTREGREHLFGFWLRACTFDGAAYLEAVRSPYIDHVIAFGPNRGRSGQPRAIAYEAAVFALVGFLRKCGLTIRQSTNELADVVRVYFPHAEPEEGEETRSATGTLRSVRSRRKRWPPKAEAIYHTYQAFAKTVGTTSHRRKK